MYNSETLLPVFTGGKTWSFNTTLSLMIVFGVSASYTGSTIGFMVPSPLRIGFFGLTGNAGNSIGAILFDSPVISANLGVSGSFGNSRNTGALGATGATKFTPTGFVRECSDGFNGSSPNTGADGIGFSVGFAIAGRVSFNFGASSV